MKKVLIVEDDPFIRDITTIKLTEHGYAITALHNGETALASLALDVPDVVLLDLDLPDMSGFDIISAIKKSDVLKNVFIIIFSNTDNPDARKKAEEVGVHTFFVKATTDYTELFSKIDSL